MSSKLSLSLKSFKNPFELVIFFSSSINLSDDIFEIPSIFFFIFLLSLAGAHDLSSLNKILNTLKYANNPLEFFFPHCQ